MTITATVSFEYDIEYTYDQGGTRLSKVDHLLDYATAYVYDVHEDPEDVGYQKNNRLLYQGSTDGQSTFDIQWYQYGADGNIARLVKDTGGPSFGIWWFYYDTSGRLWLTVSGSGDYDDELHEVSNATFDLAAEYRYEGGRQRYMWRLRNPNDDFAILDSQWRDYAGDEIHRDYTVDSETGDVTNGWSYLAGIGFDDNSSHAPKYFSSDQIGTTRRIADSNGCEDEPPACSPNVTRRPIFTAFGEPVDNPLGNFERYGYAGAFGYERPAYGAGDPLALLGWLHVGERYYAPEIGRFVQRDPIGISGGTNTYAYVLNSPVVSADPDGNHPVLLVAAAIIALDYAAQYANAPGLGDSNYSGTEGPSGAGIIASLFIPFGGPSAGVVQVGVRWPPSTAFKLWGSRRWLVGSPQYGIIRALGYRRILAIPIPFAYRLFGKGGKTTINCFWTVIRQIGRGWGLP